MTMRWWALAILLLWLATLAMPATLAVGPDMIGGMPLAAWGWYAHPFWAWNLVRMRRGRAPRLVPALLAAALGLVALQPWHSAMDEHGWYSADVPLAGAFLWAAVMSAPLAWLLGAWAGRVIARRTR